MPTARRIAYLRLVGAMLTLAGLALGFHLHRVAIDYRAEFEQWLID